LSLKARTVLGSRQKQMAYGTTNNPTPGHCNHATAIKRGKK